jgi:hypothetical protein
MHATTSVTGTPSGGATPDSTIPPCQVSPATIFLLPAPLEFHNRIGPTFECRGELQETALPFVAHNQNRISHVGARKEAVDDKSGLEDCRHLGRRELHRLSAGYVSVRFNLYAAGEQIARVRLDLVTLVGEMLLVVG